jgi:hypothetical protein
VTALQQLAALANHFDKFLTFQEQIDLYETVTNSILDSETNVRKQSLIAIQILTEKLNISSELGRVIQLDYIAVCIQYTEVSLVIQGGYVNALKSIKEEED